jgi:hypothetical protein
MRWYLGNIGPAPIFLGMALHLFIISYCLGFIWNTERIQYLKDTLYTLTRHFNLKPEIPFESERVIASFAALGVMTFVNIPILFVVFSPYIPLASFVENYITQFFGSAEYDHGYFITMSCYGAIYTFYDAWIGTYIESSINNYLRSQVLK